MNNKNMSSGKGLTLVKTTHLPGQERVTVVASLPTNQSRDVTANIPIFNIKYISMHPFVGTHIMLDFIIPPANDV